METDTYRLVSVNDPYIETERMLASDMGKYVDTRDMVIIEPYFGKAKKPTIFHCREVPYALWTYVEEGRSETERYRRAFQCGLVRVDNLAQDNDQFIPVWEPPRSGPTNLTVIEDEALAKRFRPYQWTEIGQVIHTRSFLGPRTVRFYALPPMSHTFLAQREYRPAEPSQKSQAQNSAEVFSDSTDEVGQGKQEPTDQRLSDAAGSSDEATVAHAAGM